MLVLLLAACGGEEHKVTVTQKTVESHAATQARYAAQAAERDFETLAGRELAGVGGLVSQAKQAWERGEELRRRGQDAEAQDAYADVQRHYRAATEAVAKAVKEREEEVYLAAVKSQAKAVALRKQVDALRRVLADRVAQAQPGWERDLFKQVADHCEKEVFSGKVLLEIDTKLETARAFFQSKRYEIATAAFDEARTSLDDLPKLCEKAEGRLRAFAMRDRAQEARTKAEQFFRAQKLSKPRQYYSARGSIRKGNELLADGEHRTAEVEFEGARSLFEQAFAMAPVLLATRDEAARTARATARARKAWRDFARAEGIDPDGPAASAETMIKRGAELAREGQYSKASKAFREAEKVYNDLLEKSKAALDHELEQKQRGPAPEPEGKYPSALQRRVVGLGLHWLAKHQDEDGRWNCDEFFKLDPHDDRCDGTGGALYDVGVSGLALLAFLRAGFSDRGEGTQAYYARNIRRGLRYLLSSQDKEGVYGTRATHYFIYSHALAAQAMAEAYARTKDKRYRKSAQMAVNWLAMARNPHLAWRYEPRGNQNDTSVTFWCIEALEAARRAGLEVDKEAFKGALDWVDKMTDPDFGQVGYNFPGGSVARPEGMQDEFPALYSQAMTSAGLLMRVICGGNLRNDVVSKGADLLRNSPPLWNPDRGTIDMYYWYLGTRAMARVGSRNQRRVWDKALRKAVTMHQHPKGSGARTGSWDPIGAWGTDGGRVYSTAIMVLTAIPPPAK